MSTMVFGMSPWWCTPQCELDRFNNGFSSQIGQHVHSPHLRQPHLGKVDASSSRTSEERCKPKQAKNAASRSKPKQAKQALCAPMSHTAPSDPTTICFKNIPNFYNRTMVLQLLDSNGFDGSYDFIYVPHSFKRLPTLVNLGYFFVNFASHEVASRAWAAFVGFKGWVKHSDKVMDATWATTTQGQNACIERFQNSRVNSASVPLECKPLILQTATTQNDDSSPTRCRVSTLDFFDLRALVDSKTAASAGNNISSADHSTTDESADSETGAASSDAVDEASESETCSTCIVTATWPVSRKSVKWVDVTEEESDSELGSMSPLKPRNRLALTLLQSTFTDRGMDKSVSVKNTFIEFDESPIAARRTRFASSFM